MAPHIDVLVNNAGLEKYYFYTKYSTEDITTILSVNLLAPMELTRLLLPDMLERKMGHIINISSLGGKIGEQYNTGGCQDSCRKN
jgi:short-subunit dehydrogenase